MDVRSIQPGALTGVKVVDLTRYGAGPVCTLILGDMGADVVKVEPPTGDPIRMSPPIEDDRSAAFMAFNRNKKSITLDTRTGKGKEVLKRLVQWGDVLVENFRPGTMEQWGFAYEQVRALNPRVVMVSVSGFGQTGPYAHRAAFDMIAQAMSGVMSITGEANGPPMLCGPIIGDLIGGYFGTIGTLAALYARKETGKGQYVEASMYEALVFTMSHAIAFHTFGASYGKGSFPSAPLGTFLTSDNVYIFIAGHDNVHFPHIAKLAGRPAMANDPEYLTRPARLRHEKELNQMLAGWVRSHTIAEVERALDEGGVPYGQVQNIADLLQDQHLRERGAIVEMADGDGSPMTVVGPHPRLYGTPSSMRTPVPHLGEHNYEVYHNMLGYSASEIDGMKQLKIV